MQIKIILIFIIPIIAIFITGIWKLYEFIGVLIKINNIPSFTIIATILTIVALTMALFNDNEDLFD